MIVRSWMGIAAACVAIGAGGLLLSVHIHARLAAPGEKAYVDELREKARTDIEIQKILQPELDRQHQAAVRTRSIYDWSGLILLIMGGIFLAWFRWLRPGSGAWVEVPAWLLKFVDANAAVPAIKVEAPSQDYCRMGQRECKRYGRKGPCDLPECPLAVAEKKKAGKDVGVVPYVFQPLDERIYGRLSALAAGKAASGNGPATDDGGPTRILPKGMEVASVPVEIRIGLASCGIAAGARQVRASAEESIAFLGGGAKIKSVGCNGACHNEPIIEFAENGHRTGYTKVKPEDVSRIVRRHVKPIGLRRQMREQVRRLRERMFEDGSWKPLPAPDQQNDNNLKRQVRYLLENCGDIEPSSIEDYRRRKGFCALEKCLQHCSPEEVIAQVRAAGMRNRNSSGLATAETLDKARRANPGPRRIVAPSHEIDPGSFINRALLESDPWRIIEGMAIAAYAVGAPEGLFLIGREQGVAGEIVNAAIAQAERNGWLGERILDTSFSFRVRVDPNAEAAEDGRDPRDMYLAAGGIETLACLPWILREGPEAFASLGTQTSKGTKLFSLTGAIRRGGLIEVPMGISLAEIVEETGGGISRGAKFKAAMIGGFEGGCVPASMAGTRIDYEELAAAGVSMGSGGLLILDDHSCAVDIARYFLHLSRYLAQSEANFSCAICREGVRLLLEAVERLGDGKGKIGDLKILEEISGRVREECGCRLSRYASNLVLVLLQHFRTEFEAHILERRCPAGVCKSLIHYRILDTCTGCTICAKVCPVDAIPDQPYRVHQVNDDLCTRCGMCLTACPEDAIRVG